MLKLVDLFQSGETKTKHDNLGKNKEADKIGSRAETTSDGLTEEDKETELGEETTNGPPANEPTEKVIFCSA